MGNAESVLYRNIDINELIKRKDVENKSREYSSINPEYSSIKHNEIKYKQCWSWWKSDSL